MNYFSKGFAFSIALTLGVSACMTSGSSPTLVSPDSQQVGRGQAISLQNGSNERHQVRFRIDLPSGGFRTQQIATAQYAKLEIWNKYTLAAMNQMTPIYADGADENGFVAVNGNQFILGAEVPEGPNWLVTARLYASKNDHSEIQQLKAAFHLPTTAEVVINHRSTVAARILEALQTINSPLVLQHQPGPYPTHPSPIACEILGQATQCQLPLDLTATQAFADAFTGANSNPTPPFPEVVPGGNNPELQLPLSNALVRFLRIEELTPTGDEGMALPPPVSMADIDFFKIADDLSDGAVEPDYTLTGTTLQLSAQSGQMADPAHYRFPLYLVGRKPLVQRDSTGGTLALNPDTKRLLIHNQVLDVSVRDPQETLQSIQLLGGGQFGAMTHRSDLNRIDSAYPVLGFAKAPEDTQAQPAVFITSRYFPNPPSNDIEGLGAGPITLHALHQDSLSTLWSYTFEKPPAEHQCDCNISNVTGILNANRTRFAPVLDREGGSDVVYTAFNAVNNGFAFRGIYKIKDGQMLGFAPLYKASRAGNGVIINDEQDHAGETLPASSSQLNFTAGGALSEALYTDAIRDYLVNPDTGAIETPVIGQTHPSKRLFALTGAGNSSTDRPELIVVDVDESNPLDARDQLLYYGNLRRLRFPLPQGEMLHDNSSPVIARLPNGEEVVYFSAYRHYLGSGVDFESVGFIYAYHPQSKQLAKVYTTAPQISVTGQTNHPPTIANINGETHLYVANDYGELYSLRQGATWNAELLPNWKVQVGRMRPPLMFYGSPDIAKRNDGKLALYMASSTIDGRIYEIDPHPSAVYQADPQQRIRNVMFPGGFFSAGSAIHDGHMYITTRSGNYGDFTQLRSLQLDVQGLATHKAEAPWPKTGGNYANNGNSMGLTVAP